MSLETPQADPPKIPDIPSGSASVAFERTRGALEAAAARVNALADAQLSALQQEHAKIVPALEASARSIPHLDAELRAARADGSALASELTTSRETVAALTVQINRGESEVNAVRSELNAANSQAGSYLQLLPTHERRGFDHNMFRELDAQVGAASAGHHALESERDRLQGQLAAKHDELAAKDEELAAKDAAAAVFDQENRKLPATLERTRGALEAAAARVNALADAQLSALQQEHAKIVPALEASARSIPHLDAELQAARADGSALASELTTSRETVAALTVQINRGESEVNAVRSELRAAKTQASAYLELLRTREWRRGFDQNMFRELDAQAGAASAGHHALESERDRLQGQLAALEAKLTAQMAAVESERTRLTAELAARDRTLQQERERGTGDAQKVAELLEAAGLRQAETAAQIAQLRGERAAQIERLQAEAHEQEMAVLMAHLQEARRPNQAIEADVKRLTEELAANVAAVAESDEENRKLRSTLERTRGALEEREFLIRRLERSESNDANVLGRIQTSIERLKSVPVGPAAGADAAAAAAADRLPELIRIDGERPTTYLLARRTRIGRAAGCEVQIDSGSVSRHHALVLVGPRDTIIEDLNSTNGVLVNGRTVTRHVLCDGDALTIGETQFRYSARLVPGSPGPNPAEPSA